MSTLAEPVLTEAEKQRRGVAADLMKKQWETVQTILGRQQDALWRIRGAFALVWWAVIVQQYTGHQRTLLVPLLAFHALIFTYELSIKAAEEQYLARNADVERALNAMYAGDFESPKVEEISTNLSTTSLKDFRIAVRRHRFWGPHLAVLIFSVVLLWSGTNAPTPCPEALPTAPKAVST